MSDRQGKTDAERQQLEDEKRELEVQKLRHDISIWARVTAVVIPIAAFIIGGAQAYIAFTDWSKKQASDVHDAEMKQIEMGVRLVEFASLESKTLTSKDVNEGKKTVTYVSTLLPLDMACQMLNAFLVDARVATELTDYISAVMTRLASRDTSSQQTCKLNLREQQDATIIDVAKLQGTPAQPEQSTGQANACTVPAPRGPTPLVVYYQVVRSEDRDIAAKIGYRIPPEFPSAGIEYVAEKDPSKQAPDVRFYQADQRDEAKYLACLVTSAYRQAVPNSTGEFNTHSLEKPNRKLPAHRIEVWFPPLGG